MSTRPVARHRHPGWIEFPPLWPEPVAARGREPGAPDERPTVVLTSRIPRLGRERPRVMRIVTGARAR